MKSTRFVSLSLSYSDFLMKNADSFHHIALNLTKNEADAQDLVAQTWARMWRFLSKFDPARASMLTWGVAIMRNVWFEEMQRRRFRRHYDPIPLDASDNEETFRLLEVLAEHGSRIRNDLERAWIAAAVRKAMASLKESERLAIESKLKGHDGVTAAAELGWPRRTVDARAFDAYTKMRPILAAAIG